MKNVSIISFICILLFVPNIKAQNIAPLKLGNIWVYYRNTTTARTTLVDTNTYINTIPYCKLFIEVNYGAIGNSYVRLKSDGFYVLYNEFDSTETTYYKKYAVIGDTWTVGTLVYSIEDTSVANVFGEPTTIKLLIVDDGLIHRQEYWTEKFGKLGSEDFGGVLDDLQGCVIDGTAYGDTSFTIVNVGYEFETPNSFYFAQNYPNPFNPSTTIKFALPVNSKVKINIYNSLGQLVETLVDKEMESGYHEVNFDASRLASGVYFYQLQAQDYVSVKKMLLLK